MGDVARLKAMLGHTVLREEWLDRAGGILERWVFSGHVQVPAYRVSVGWPLGSRVSKRPGEAGCVGQCFSASCSSDYVAQIFISPTLSDSIKVLGVLAHEIIHAIFPTAGHRGLFRKLALAIGLEGEMTSTYPGAALKEIFESKVLKELGDYPGAALSYHTTKKRKKMQSKKQSFIEANINTLSGFIVSYITLITLNHFYQMNLSMFESLEITAIFTVSSIVRNYLIRRWFNRKINVAKVI